MSIGIPGSGGARRGTLVILFICVAWTLTASAPVAVHAADDDDLAASGWVWPIASSRVVAPWIAPAHEYGPGHRGIDLQGQGAAASDLRAPADGVVAFAGSVAGRGVLTIDHGSGLVTTLEPVETGLTAGTSVTRGQTVATLSAGGHAPPGAVHFGVRRDGAYINPQLLLGSVPRAVLLPCCEDLQF